MSSTSQPPPPPPPPPQPPQPPPDNPVNRESRKAVRIAPLGGGDEVGRSCVLMQLAGKTVLFDCGIHPAYDGFDSLPYYRGCLVDPSTIDLILVTSFHLDRAGALPYFMTKEKFRGRVFMTPPTKHMYRLLLSDYVKVGKGYLEQPVQAGECLYNEVDILRSMDNIEVIDYLQSMEVNGILFWCFPAGGDVLGAAMFSVDIDGVKVLYTGDSSFELDRHYLRTPPETIPRSLFPQTLFPPDICIIDSTYGTQLREPRNIIEKRFTEVIHSTIAQGGRVLIPAFAVGHSLELLSILDEYWSNHPELHNVPIYHASPLARSCEGIYKDFIDSMIDRIRCQLANSAPFDLNDRIPSLFANSNPFDLKHISPLKRIEDFDDVGPCVVIASPSGLQRGLSRQFFDKWCGDEKNACVIPEYAFEGTLAKTILNKPKPMDVPLMSGLTAPLNMHVHYIPFFVHADFTDMTSFLKKLMPPTIILVRGEPNDIGEVKQSLELSFSPDTDTEIFSPENCHSVVISFLDDKISEDDDGDVDVDVDDDDDDDDDEMSEDGDDGGLQEGVKIIAFPLVQPADNPSQV